MSGKKKKTKSASHGDERDATHGHLYRLAQATALLRALKTVIPAGAVWESPDEIPPDVMQRALALLAKTSDGQIQPSAEDFAAVQRNELQN
jgi:hypothetical protein